jgi:Xaa-Pro aminopeptidase
MRAWSTANPPRPVGGVGGRYRQMAEPIFPKSEFDGRYERARKLMAAAGFQAIIAYSPGNQFWLSGFRGSAGAGRIPEYRQQVILPKVVLPLTGGPALTGLTAIAEAYAQETHFDDIRPVMSPADRPRMIRQILESRGMRTGTVGLDIGSASGISPGELDALRHELSGLELRDASKLFWRLRMIKTPAEIACMRRAVEIQNAAFKSFCRRISRKMTESDLMFEMLSCQREEGANEIGMVLSTTHPTGAIFGAQISGRSMQPGDLQWFDAGATYNGYTCDFDILIAWGEATTDQIKTHGQLKDVYQEAMEAWRPGRPFAEIASDTTAVLEKHGARDLLQGSFLGHCLGAEVVERPWFGTHAPKGLTLEQGMVIAPEWVTATALGNFLWERNFLVTADGLEELSNFPDELTVITK